MSKALELASEIENQKHQGSRRGAIEEVAAELRRLADIEHEHRALLVNEQNLREELAALKASLGEPVAEIIINDDDFDMGLKDDFAFGKKQFPNGTHDLYALTNKDQS